jgi:hypothetical protein
MVADTVLRGGEGLPLRGGEGSSLQKACFKIVGDLNLNLG